MLLTPQLPAQCEAVYRRFVAPEATLPVNVQAASRTKATTLFNERKFTPDMFVQARREVRLYCMHCCVVFSIVNTSIM